MNAVCLNSDVLREALGISTQQLPPYIYQMRILGYPPGHLENAKQSTSGLTMFDKHGQGEVLMTFILYLMCTLRYFVACVVRNLSCIQWTISS